MRVLVLALATAMATMATGHCEDRDGNRTATIGCLEQTYPKREQTKTDLWPAGSSSGDSAATVSVGTSVLCDQLVHTIERLDLNSVSTEDLHELIQAFESSCFPPEAASSHSAVSGSDAGSTNSSISSSSSSSSGSRSGSRSHSSELANARSSKRTTTIVSVVMAEVVVVVAVLATVVYSRRRKQLQREQKSLEEIENAQGDRLSADPTELTQLRIVGAPFDSVKPPPLAQNVQMMPPFRPPTGVSSDRTGLWDDPAILVVRIPRDKVLVEELVDRGGYGEVYRGSYKGQSVAIKSLLPGIAKDIKQINAFLAEAKIMASIEHERVVRFVGVAWDSLSDMCVVTEFMDGGDLRALLTRFEEHERRPCGFDADKLKIALHVAQALTYLHSLEPVVVHRDLKSRNILLNSRLDAKLTDFGVSRRHDTTMTAGVGTAFWMAPEVMMGESYDEKADIFSFGVVLTELDSHQLPYSSDKFTDSGRIRPDAAILQMVAIGILRARFSANVAKSIKALGRACLALDPRDRPTAAEVMFRLQAAAL